MLEVGIQPILDSVSIVAHVQRLQTVPKVTVDVCEIVMQVSYHWGLFIKITRREYFPVILQGKIRHSVVVRLPLIMSPSGVIMITFILGVGSCQVGNALQQRQQELTGRLRIVLTRLHPLAEMPDGYRK